MCRSIRRLYNMDPPPEDDEVRAASIQYVRKVSGFRRPSAANQAAFDAAVREIAGATRRLLDDLSTAAPPRPRSSK